ncbi:hypothetical protein [Streptomyces sp. ODS28]|uniref:hypothetical protein n=1 Tax=Streptomyces sp. ODS28 TaxID=3136688 RepID=UPI0031EA6FDD
MEARDPELKRDLDASLQTRKELGPEYERELVDSFLGKVEERVDGIVDKRVRRQLAEQQMVVARGGAHPAPRPRGYAEGLGARLGMAIASLVLAIPLSAIAVVNAGLPGLLICWAGIVGVNAAAGGRSWFGLLGGKHEGEGRGKE